MTTTRAPDPQEWKAPERWTETITAGTVPRCARELTESGRGRGGCIEIEDAEADAEDHQKLFRATFDALQNGRRVIKADAEAERLEDILERYLRIAPREGDNGDRPKGQRKRINLTERRRQITKTLNETIAPEGHHDHRHERRALDRESGLERMAAANATTTRMAAGHPVAKRRDRRAARSGSSLRESAPERDGDCRLAR